MNIEKLRKAKNLKQEELAKAVGVTHASISRYENGKREPKISTAMRMAAVLDCTMDELVGEGKQGQ